VAEPTERWSAARWGDACEHWVRACDAAGTPPLVVGGTGLYLRVISEPFWHEPEHDRRTGRGSRIPRRAFGGRAAALGLVLDPERAHLGAPSSCARPESRCSPASG
jgi:tRNA dimethylallyltransferase